MRDGVGSSSMMTAASTALAAVVPKHSETVLSFAAASQLLTSFIGTYIMYFLAVPLQKFMYVHITHVLDHKREVYPEHD